MKPRSPLTLSIIQMAQEGYTKSEIARLARCSWVHVNNTLRHAQTPQLIIAPLTPEQSAWLRREAAKSGVNMQTMARAMLVDAIDEEMMKC